jgi:hypothetical protein
MRVWSGLLLAFVGLVTVAFAAPPPEVAKELDRRLQDELFTPASAQLAPRTDDETFLRRVTLDTVGRQPLPDEVTKFALDPDPAKREKLIEKLLATEKYGQNWARYWRDVIMYRLTEQRAQIASQPLQDYLSKQLNENAPWSDVATAFITAIGDVKENGNAALIVAQEGKPEETVAEISRIFLGINIQCAQCHDHPTDRWKREQFHELAAFFPRVASRPEMGDQRTIIVSANDGPGRGFRGGNAMFRFRGMPEHFMSDLNNPQARGKQMQPVFFLTGQSLPTGTKDAERRETLAKWITAKDNEYFAKALVNRLWSELVGEGFYEPVDDIGPDRTPTAPYTLNYLSKEFIASGYDVKWLFTTIVSSEAYQRESRPRREANQTPFTANVPQRLRADQIYDNLLTALNLSGGRGMYGGRGGARFTFQSVFGYDPSTPRDEVQGSIPQALAMMNGGLVNGAMTSVVRGSGGRGSWLARTPNDDDAISDLYLGTLARSPSERELTTCKEYIKESNSRTQAYEDLLWTLVNSAEFLHRR